MKIEVLKENGVKIAKVTGSEVLIKDEQSAIDLFATVDYETGCNNIMINKAFLHEEFFDLSNKIAGGILQKFINYKKRLVIIGDFSIYTSKSLKDFIYECNQGKDIFFLESEEEAIKRLSEY